jgi:hypothetical protein
MRPAMHGDVREGRSPDAAPGRVSAELDGWLRAEPHPTLGGLIAVSGHKSFAIAFVLLLGVPALPIPTGGATHLLELVAILLALELVAGRKEIWLPGRWKALRLGGPTRRRFLHALLALIRRLERVSRPRLRLLFEHRLSNVVFGALVAAGSIAAFLAPPFSGLDTLPALGVVLVSLGVLLEDVVFVALGILAAATGVALDIVLARAALHGLGSLL